MRLIYKALVLSISTFETPPCNQRPFIFCHGAANLQQEVALGVLM